MEMTVSKNEPVNGKTLIDHQICQRLRINLIEYILLDYFSTHTKKSEDFNSDRLHRHKGLKWSDPIVKACLKSIENDGLIKIEADGKFQLLPKWTKFFLSDSDFDNDDKDNPGFWQIFQKTGNKAMAKKAYSNARKHIGKDELHAAASNYIKNCNECSRFIMHASTYLNPVNEHWKDVLPDPPKKKEEPVTPTRKFNDL
jgi:hypothetical protein